LWPQTCKSNKATKKQKNSHEFSMIFFVFFIMKFLCNEMPCAKIHGKIHGHEFSMKLHEIYFL